MDDYSDWEKSKKEMNRSSFKIWQKAKPIHVIFIAILFFISQKIVQNNKENKFVWVIVAALGILYLYTLTRGEETKNVIPRHIAEQIALKDLRKEIGVAYTNGTTINSTSYFKDQSWDDGEGPKLFKYNIGFKIIEPGRTPRDIIYQMNPFSGICKGIVEAISGFTGEDIKDIQQIFPEKFIKDEKK